MKQFELYTRVRHAVMFGGKSSWEATRLFDSILLSILYNDTTIAVDRILVDGKRTRTKVFW